MSDAAANRCWINRGGFALDGKTHMTGAQIRALPMPSIRDDDDLYMEVPGDEDVLVKYDEVVPVVGRRFFSVPRIINAGASDAALIADCPTPEYHETHRYCPSCPWTEPQEPRIEIVDEMPPRLEGAVKHWLRVNEREAVQVRHGVFPLGFVHNLIDQVNDGRRLSEEMEGLPEGTLPRV